MGLVEANTALAAIDVLLNDEVVTVHTSNSIQASYNSFHLPARIVAQLGANEDIEQTTRTTSVYEFVYKISDLMLLATKGDASIAKHMDDLERYISAYQLTVRPKLRIAPDMHVIATNGDLGWYTYPAGTGNHYYGVQMITTIKEVVIA